MDAEGVLNISLDTQHSSKELLGVVEVLRELPKHGVAFKDRIAMTNRLDNLLHPPPPYRTDPFKKYRRTRALCRSATLSWAVLWVLVLTPSIKAGYWSVLEFMMTPVAETAALIELLVTLPSQKAGPEAVLHYRVLQVIYATGTGILYQKNLGLAAWYVAIHLIKAVYVGWLRRLARERLYDKFVTRCDEQAVSYLESLLKILGTQLALLALAVGEYMNSGLDLGYLLATMTLSSVLPAAFVFLVFVRDAGNITRDRITTLDFRPLEVASFGAIGAFALTGILAYAVIDSDSISVASGRGYYFTYEIVYFVAAGLVGLVVHRASESSKKHTWRKFYQHVVKNGKVEKYAYYYCEESGYSRWAKEKKRWRSEEGYDWIRVTAKGDPVELWRHGKPAGGNRGNGSSPSKISPDDSPAQALAPAPTSGADP